MSPENNFRLGCTHAVAQLRAFIVCEQSLNERLSSMAHPSQVAEFWLNVVAKSQGFDAEKVCMDALTARNQAELDRDSARAQRDRLLDALQACLAFWNCPPSGYGADAARKRKLSEIIEQSLDAVSKAGR